MTTIQSKQEKLDIIYKLFYESNKKFAFNGANFEYITHDDNTMQIKAAIISGEGLWTFDYKTLIEAEELRLL